MVGTDGRLPLPWLAPVLERTLRDQHAHALLVHGPQGVGQFELAVVLAQAWLCEAPARGQAPAPHPCGICASCHLVQAHSHPDLLVLLPEALQPALGWGGADDEAAGERAARTKPSQELKVEAVRAAIAFAQTTSARGRCKVVVLYPAERLNGVAANALLKTLEEPFGDARFLLGCTAPDALPATVRSRCQNVALQLPPAAVAIEWLEEQGVADAPVLLAAAGGQPQEALDWARQGINAELWRKLPWIVAQGQPQPFAAWPLARTLDALQKLCHDAACMAVGAEPRYFPAAAIPATGRPEALLDWMRELMRIARRAEHPWNVGLVVESLVQRGRQALSFEATDMPRRLSDLAPGSVHSGP